MLTMTLEGLLLGLPKRPDGGRLQYRCAWRGSSDLAHRCGRVPLFYLYQRSQEYCGRSQHYRPVLRRRPRDASETGDPVRRRELPADRGAGTGPFDLSQGEDYSGAPTACRGAGSRPYHPLGIMLHSLDAPGIVKDSTGMAGAREGARHRADWLSRIDLAGEGMRVEGVGVVGGGDPHVDSVVRTRVRAVGLAPRRCCRVVRGFEPRSGPQ